MLHEINSSVVFVCLRFPPITTQLVKLKAGGLHTANLSIAFKLRRDGKACGVKNQSCYDKVGVRVVCVASDVKQRKDENEGRRVVLLATY